MEKDKVVCVNCKKEIKIGETYILNKDSEPIHPTIC